MSPEVARVTNALTVDLEDWYHGLTRTMRSPGLWSSLTQRSEISTALLLDLLAEASVKATFFVLGDLAEKSPVLIRRIADAGHELGSHGYTHRLIHTLTPDQFREELDMSRDIIQETAGRSVIGFRAPQFSINQSNLWAFRVLSDAGFEYDSSIFPAKSLFYGDPTAKPIPHKPLSTSSLIEYPVATIPIAGITIPVGGGVYNRWLPGFFSRWAYRQLNQQGRPVILYLHPWELDLEQPRIKVSIRELITHYGNRASLADKLRHICRTFNFVTLETLHHEIIQQNRVMI